MCDIGEDTRYLELVAGADTPAVPLYRGVDGESGHGYVYHPRPPCGPPWRQDSHRDAVGHVDPLAVAVGGAHEEGVCPRGEVVEAYAVVAMGTVVPTLVESLQRVVVEHMVLAGEREV